MDLLKTLQRVGLLRNAMTKQQLTGEVAHSSPYLLYARYGGPAEAYNPSTLMAKGGFRLIDEIRRDDQVKAALNLKKLAVIAPGWTVETPPELRDVGGEDWDRRRFVDHQFNHIEGSFHRVLYDVLSALDYGYSVTEKVYAAGDKHEDEWSGMLNLQALKTRRPHEVTFAVDQFGTVEPDGVLQQQQLGQARMPRDKFLLFAYNGEFGNPYGTSDLESVYRAWYHKKAAYANLAMYLERFGIPPVFLLYDPSAMRPDQLAALKDVFSNMQSATSAMIPRKTPESAEIWSPELAGQVSSVFIPALDKYNQDIARALLMPQMLGITADVAEGSFSRAQVHFDVFLLVVEHLRHLVAEEVVNEQIIHQLIDLNYGGGPYPVFTFNPITREQQGEILAAWSGLVGAGVVVNQPDDEYHVREMIGFPPVDEEWRKQKVAEEEARRQEELEALAAAEAAKAEEPVPGASDEESAPGGEGQPAKKVLPFAFDPDQARDDSGKWTSGGGGGGGSGSPIEAGSILKSPGGRELLVKSREYNSAGDALLVARDKESGLQVELTRGQNPFVQVRSSSLVAATVDKQPSLEQAAETAGYIADGFAELQTMGLEMPRDGAPEVLVSQTNSGSSYYHQGAIVISPLYAGGSFEDMKSTVERWEQRNGVRWGVSASEETAEEMTKSTFRHEIAHYIDDFGGEVRDTGWASTGLVRAYEEGLGLDATAGSHDEIRAYVELAVSKYATTNKEEMFAETFTLYSSPRYKKGTLPEQVEAYMAGFFKA